MPSLRDHVVLITGAGSGLGRQLALELAREQAFIAAVDLHAAPLQSLAEEIGTGRAAWAIADVGNRAALAAAVADLERRLGAIDVLIANAGIGLEMPADEFRPEDLEKQVRVNLVGVANAVGAVLPGMLRRGRGQLVAISSLAAYRGFPRGAGYCASKAGVNALMDSLRTELRPRGIHCTTVCPGWIRTPLAQGMALPRPGSMDADRAARRIVRAVRGQRSFVAFPFLSRAVVALLARLPAFLVDGPMRAYLERHRTKRARTRIAAPHIGKRAS